jgi:hypothetical protein
MNIARSPLLCTIAVLVTGSSAVAQQRSTDDTMSNVIASCDTILKQGGSRSSCQSGEVKDWCQKFKAQNPTCVAIIRDQPPSGHGHAGNSWEQQQIENGRLQKQALQQKEQQPVRPQVLQAERWKREWMQQHPGEPVPSMGVLEHLHEGEIIANVKADGKRMHQARQAELQRNYKLAREHQAHVLASQHITWSTQQWNDWDREYDRQMKQRADEYREAIKQAGEIERAEEERRRMMGY